MSHIYPAKNKISIGIRVDTMFYLGELYGKYILFKWTILRKEDLSINHMYYMVLIMIIGKLK